MICLSGLKQTGGSHTVLWVRSAEFCTSGAEGALGVKIKVTAGRAPFCRLSGRGQFLAHRDCWQSRGPVVVKVSPGFLAADELGALSGCAGDQALWLRQRIPSVQLACLPSLPHS